jgi:hypothetical protein
MKLIVLVLCAAAAGALRAAELPQPVPAKLEVVGFAYPSERDVRFMERVWVNKTAEPCTFFDLTADGEEKFAGVRCGELSSIVILKKFPKDPIVLVHKKTNGKRHLAIGQ